MTARPVSCECGETNPDNFYFHSRQGKYYDCCKTCFNDHRRQQHRQKRARQLKQLTQRCVTCEQDKMTALFLVGDTLYRSCRECRDRARDDDDGHLTGPLAEVERELYGERGPQTAREIDHCIRTCKERLRLAE